MGEKITLTLQERTAQGKKVRQLRRDGIVPAVVYGPGMDPVSVQVDQVIMGKVYQAAGKHAPVHLTIGEKKRIAMIKDVEVDNVKRRINHVSFHAVRQNKPVEAEVPVRLVGEGESEAEKAGLIILQNLDKLEVKALPMDLPEALEVSIIHFKEAGERVLVSDIIVPENVEIVDNDDGQGDEDDQEERNSVMDQLVASVWEPSALQAANESSGGDAEDESEVTAENGAEEETTESTEAASEEKKD